MRNFKLETENLLIRSFNETDWKEAYEYLSDNDVMKYMPDNPFSEEEAKSFASENSGDEPEALAVVLKDEDRLIGHMVFHPWFAPRTYEIGWVFNKNYQGKGYATEAARELLKYGFKNLKLHRIISTCNPENPPSYRVMDKLFMRSEGHFKECILRNGNWEDEYFYAMLDKEYDELEKQCIS
jgi:[ribosomal protein S5]-alanine N-acetyltransferase